MTQVSVLAVGLAASALVASAVVAGCGNDTSSSPSSSASSSASSTSAPSSSAAPSSSTSGAGQPSNYSNLLIKPSDISVPGDTFKLDQSGSDPSSPGINGDFSNQDGSRKIHIMIGVFPDANAATQVNNDNAKNTDLFVKGTPPSPIDVGTGGVMAVGQDTSGRSSAVALFAEGKAAATIVFDSAPNDPVSPDFVLDLARKQDAAIKAGLPS